MSTLETINKLKYNANQIQSLYLVKIPKWKRDSHSSPILIAEKEVHIRFENFPTEPNIITDQYQKQDIISVVNLSKTELSMGSV